MLIFISGTSTVFCQPGAFNAMRDGMGMDYAHCTTVTLIQ